MRCETLYLLHTMLPEEKILGQKVDYPTHYAPEVLVAVPRSQNRETLGIDENNIPFVGVDTWHAYELSFLTTRGVPVAGVMKMIYPACSPYIIESKSLKLYLNSFNMEEYGLTPEVGMAIVENIIKQDIYKCIGERVRLRIYSASENLAISYDFEHYSVLEDSPCAKGLSISEYKENPDLLEGCNKDEIKVASHLLRSNCRITHQPDWGSVYIYMRGETCPTNLSLLKYIVSLRSENHFHEEICELIFMRLLERFKPEELAVTCAYTRRGGIDICPSRATSSRLLPTGLCDYSMLTRKLIRN